MALDDIRPALKGQGFVVFRDRNGDFQICKAGKIAASQPGNEKLLRDAAVRALTEAGFVWPRPPR